MGRVFSGSFARLHRASLAALGLLSAMACGSAAPAPSTPTPAHRPNFVVIVADDMAADLFATGRRCPFLQLPNLDRLASRSVVFDRAFVTTSLCSPSRASMLTGLYAHTHGVEGNEDMDLPAQFATFPRLLRQNGYHTALVGKWHMDATSDAPRPGFDYWLSFRGQGVYEDPTLNENGRRFVEAGYTTDILTSHAVQWLATQGTEPFALILAHKAVHAPFHPAPRHLSAYADGRMPEPPSFRDDLASKPAWQRRYAACGGGASAFDNCPDPLPQALDRSDWPDREPWRLDYMRTLLALDDSVGAVVAALQSQGLAESTYVLFTSDNGFLLGEHRMGDKRLAYEESMRVPLVIAGPSLAPRHATGFALNVDIAPTILELAGLAPPPGIDGRSLTPLMRDAGASVHDRFLYEYFRDASIPVVPTIFALRTQQYTYVRSPGEPRDELYDLTADPHELTNLAGRPQWETVRAGLQQQLRQLAPPDPE